MIGYGMIMGNDKVKQIMQDLTIQKNEDVTKELAELKKKKKEYNGISEQELLGLSNIFKEPEEDA